MYFKHLETKSDDNAKYNEVNVKHAAERRKAVSKKSLA